jgi:16S rRNA (cytosine1402-N4)-methyltransferase
MTGATMTHEPLPAGDAYHVPVLRAEVVAALAPAAQGTILDGTAGGGGHSHALLEAYPECRLVAVDRDPEAVAAVTERLAPFGDRVRILRDRFDRAALRLAEEGVALSGALLDLGISSRHIDATERGFTHRDEAPLDMRMAGDAGDEAPTAADILNHTPEDELSRMFRRLGEEPRSRALARRIVERREAEPFRTAADLNAVVAAVYRRPGLAKEKARVYQALRIMVNDELQALEAVLPVVRDLLEPGGIFAVLSYHSLEDRRVKNAFREWSRSCVCPPELPECRCRGRALGTVLTRSPVGASPEEVARNPRSRSVRFRVWRKAP